MEFYTYKGISAGKYIEGEVEALNQEEASHKLKADKVIITNLVKSKKKKDEKKAKKKGQTRRCCYFFKTICYNGQGRAADFKRFGNVKRSNGKPNAERNNWRY